MGVNGSICRCVKRERRTFSLFGQRFPTINACLQYLFDNFFGEGFNRIFLKFRRSDFCGWIGILELHVQPAEKRTESDLPIANILGGQRLCAAVEAHRLIVGAQPGQVTVEVGCFNFRNAPITDVAQPVFEREFVGGDCVSPTSGCT